MITVKWVNQFKSFCCSVIFTLNSRSWILYTILCIWDAWMHWTCFFILCLYTFQYASTATTKTALLSPKMLFQDMSRGWRQKWKLLISFNESLWNIFIINILSIKSDSLMGKYGCKNILFFCSIIMSYDTFNMKVSECVRKRGLK